MWAGMELAKGGGGGGWQRRVRRVEERAEQVGNGYSCEDRWRNFSVWSMINIFNRLIVCFFVEVQVHRCRKIEEASD